MKSSTRHASPKWVLVPEAATASSGDVVRLSQDKSRHLNRVLRMETGDSLFVIDGRGRALEGALEKDGSGHAVKLGAVVKSENGTGVVTELVICLPKNAIMDWVVEKAVECGVSTIRPVQSSRSVVRPASSELEKYVRRWQTIADAAVEQSERLWRPEVLAPIDWSAFLGQRPLPVKYAFAFVSETRGDTDEKTALQDSWIKMREVSSDPVAVLIGPEGGMSEGERADLLNLGFKLTSLGATVQRVETAVVSALTMVRLARNIA